MSSSNLAVTPPAPGRPGWRHVASSMLFTVALLTPAALAGCGPLEDLIDELHNRGGGGGSGGASGGGDGGLTNPCAAVLCLAGAHCEVQPPAVCKQEPCPPVAVCVSDTKPPAAPACGGIAGKPCPGMGNCADDPSDSCDPEKGGADCGGICTCLQNALCVKGLKFDSSPSVCACVPEKPVCGPVCGIYCTFGNVLDSQGCPTCECNKPKPGATCPTDQCTGPAPKAATIKCSDGKTVGGPACVVDANGVCNWTVVVCPA